MTAKKKRDARKRHQDKKFLKIKDDREFFDISEDEAVLAKRMRSRSRQHGRY